MRKWKDTVASPISVPIVTTTQAIHKLQDLSTLTQVEELENRQLCLLAHTKYRLLPTSFNNNYENLDQNEYGSH